MAIFYQPCKYKGFRVKICSSKIECVARFIMFRKICLFFLLATSSMFAKSIEDMQVKRIEIIIKSPGDHKDVDLAKLKAQLETKEKTRFSQVEFDRDLKTLAENYDRAESSATIEGDDVVITFSLWLKPILREICIEGNDKYKEKKLEKELGLEIGEPVDRESLVEAINKIKTLYIKGGYYQVGVEYQLVPVGTDNEVKLQMQIFEGDCGKIKRIIFEGLTSKEEDEVLELFFTKSHLMIISTITNRGSYHPEMIEHDKLVLVNYLQNIGYADATVEILTSPSESKDRIDLLVKVNKGQVYIFGDITIAGNQLICTEDLCKVLTIKERYAYSPEALRNSVQNIQDLYGNRGYIDANVDVQLFLDPAKRVYTVSFCILENEKYLVGLIKVFGNIHTQNRVILHESLICPGEFFDNRKLNATEIRLQNTGIFSSVNVYSVQSQLCPVNGMHFRDVYIEVEEADTGNIGVSMGLSSLDSIFGGFDIIERNFNLLGLTNLFSQGPSALRGAGEFAHFKANIGGKQTAYQFQWSKPYFLDTPWILGFDLEKANNRAISKAYTIKTYGGNIHMTYIENNFLKYDIFYRGQHTNVSIRDKKKHNPELLKEGQNTGMISAVGAALIYDSTNHPRRPSCGYRSRMIYELAGVGGNFQFMKGSYLNSYYYPMTKRSTLKLRADLTLIHTWGGTRPVNLPLSERLFLGGESTVRGYRPFIIGPKFQANEPRGGLTSYLLSEEYQMNLLKMPCVDAFCFVDAGWVSFKEFHFGRPAASVGLGLRIEAMKNMPMTIGMGWPIHPSEKFNGKKISNAQRFFFSMGGTF